MVAAGGFTGRASVAAVLAAGVPFILGFARSKPIRARLAARSARQRRGLREGGGAAPAGMPGWGVPAALRLGACPWDERLRLFALGARSPTDRRGPWAYVASLRSRAPNALATAYRQRWRVEQAIEELRNGNDLDHLVGCRLAPNRIALGLRLLARNLALGLQIRQADARPETIRAPRAFRAAAVEGLAAFAVEPTGVLAVPLRAVAARTCPLPRGGVTVRYASPP